MKIKTSASLPPDPSSLFQALKRVHLQVKIWSCCSAFSIPEIDPEDYGWRFDQAEDRLVPVWFIGPQLPPSFSKKSSPHRSAGTDGDDEESESEAPPKRKKRKKEKKAIETEIEVENDANQYDGDEEGCRETLASLDTNEEDMESSDESSWEVSDFLSDDTSAEEEWKP